MKIKSWNYIIINLSIVFLYWGISHINWVIFNQLGILPMPIWPAAAVALISGILYGWKAAPGIAIGAILANWFSLDAPITFACLIAIMNTLGPIISAKLIRKHLGDSLRIRSLNDIIIIFILSTILAPILTASGGIGFKWIVGLIPPDKMFVGWMKWVMANALGTFAFGLPIFTYLLTQDVSKWKKLSFLRSFIFSPIFLVSLLIAISLWLTNSLLDFIWFNNSNKPFWDMLIPVHDLNEMIMRIIMTSIILSAGITVVFVMKRIFKNEVALRKSEKRFDLALEVAGDGFFDWDMMTNKVFFDRRYYTMAGYKNNAFPHSFEEWAKRVHPDDIEQSQEQLEMYLTGKQQIFDIEFRFKCANENWMWIRGKGGVVERDNNGKPLRFVGSHSDITSRKHAEKIIASKNKELEQIVYVASHDLRSPLVNVDGFSRELEYSIKDLKSILDSGIDREELIKALQTEFLDMEQSIDRIRSSAIQMDKLLKGLLHLSRQGRATLLTEDVDMNECLSQLASSFAFAMKEKEVELIVENLPICHGDTVQMTQVFSNLIDNAIKYRSPERSLKIEINGEIKIGQAIYHIKDNGIGIAENHLDHIFELFHRLEPGKTEGEGLGLTTVRQALSRMYGEIRVESELGKGSVFIVTMPHVKNREKNNTKVEK